MGTLNTENKNEEKEEKLKERVLSEVSDNTLDARTK